MDKIYASLDQRVHVRELGIELFVGLNGDGQPTVVISTELMRAEYVYEETTGLPGTAEPYTYETDDASALVKGPTGGVISRHYGDNALSERLAAREYAALLNERWADECGMADVQVFLGDASLYDSEDHNPALRERRIKALTTS